MKIFVGNLAFSAVEADIRKLFEDFGAVSSVLIATEKKKAKPRGFCFVVMPDDAQAAAAIAALNGTIFMERAIDVVIGREKPASKPRTDSGYEYQKHYKPHGRSGDDRGYQRRRPHYGGDRSHAGYGRDAGAGTHRDHSFEKSSYGYDRRPQPPAHKGTRGGPRPAWAKDRDQGRPWKKPGSASRPWRKPEEGSEHRRKPEGESRHWRKSADGARPGSAYRDREGARPWKRTEGASRSWSRPHGESRPWRNAAGHGGARGRSGEESRPWKRSDGEARPWQKRGAFAKPWHKKGVKSHRSPHKGIKSSYRHKSA